jgi:hypothetical protein
MAGRDGVRALLAKPGGALDEEAHDPRELRRDDLGREVELSGIVPLESPVVSDDEEASEEGGRELGAGGNLDGEDVAGDGSELERRAVLALGRDDVAGDDLLEVF